MTCEMIDVVPGLEGEGVEIPCTKEAVWLLDGTPCCEHHYYADAPDDYGNVARLVSAQDHVAKE